MPQMAYDDALAFLQKIQSTGGTSVYDHLSAVLMKVLEEQPQNAVDILETSLLTKRTAFDGKEPSPLVPTKGAADAAKAVANAQLFGTPEAPIDPETGEPMEADAPNEYECEDVLSDSLLFDAVGAGIGQEEMYNVALSAKKLGEDPKIAVATVRFFGKFLGIYSDYYVFETTLQDPPEEEEAEEPEWPEIPVESGTGANGYVYFVCSYPGGPFTMLPNVKPREIKAARQIKKFLTGKLETHLSTYPPFPGTEANYLRAQIARIAATTVLCPAGYFEVDEDDEEGAINKAEEWEPLEPREMVDLANWCHRYPHLKKQGRCALFAREEPEDEEEAEGFELTEEEQEEGPALLAAIDEDRMAPGMEEADDDALAANPAWTPVFSSTDETTKFQVAGMRSNLWPGAVSVAAGAKFSNVYVGWGLKNATYVPLPPPPVAAEFDQKMMESNDLPRKPDPGAEEEEGDE